LIGNSAQMKEVDEDMEEEEEEEEEIKDSI